jgi:hypothetical protein
MDALWHACKTAALIPVKATPEPPRYRSSVAMRLAAAGGNP